MSNIENEIRAIHKLRETLAHWGIKDTDIQTIYDVGLGTSEEAVAFWDIFHPHELHCFEANPITGPKLRRGIPQYIHYNNVAVAEQTGETTFYASGKDDRLRSSCYKPLKNLPPNIAIHNRGKFRECVVPTTCLREYIDAGNLIPDLLWMDIQGGELAALRGMGEHLFKVKVVYTELILTALYEGQSLFWETDDFMQQQGFDLVSGNMTYGVFDNFLYLRKDLTDQKK